MNLSGNNMNDHYLCQEAFWLLSFRQSASIMTPCEAIMSSKRTLDQGPRKPEDSTGTVGTVPTSSYCGSNVSARSTEVGPCP
jgi:hypothetical protein